MNVGRIRDIKGFTLVEVMIVSAIIGILAWMGVPAYLDWIARGQMRQATTELAGSLNLVRTAAMSRGTGMTLTTAMVGGRATLTFSGGVSPPIMLDGRISNITAAVVGFSSFGVRAGGGAANTLIVLSQLQGGAYSVAVTPAGKITWCMKATCP